MDPDLQVSLKLPVSEGALVQDVSAGSPAERAGIRPYDIIVGLDATPVAGDEELIQRISARAPGSAVTLRVVRDDREQSLTVRLAERPARPGSTTAGASAAEGPPRDSAREPGLLGLTVRDLDAAAFNRLDLPGETRGVLITRVDPLSASFNADIRRNSVLLEINRRPIRSVADFRRIAGEARPGDILAFYLYSPDRDARELKTVHVEER
jgi:serine protease Do